MLSKDITSHYLLLQCSTQVTQSF